MKKIILLIVVCVALPINALAMPDKPSPKNTGSIIVVDANGSKVGNFVTSNPLFTGGVYIQISIGSENYITLINMQSFQSPAFGQYLYTSTDCTGNPLIFTDSIESNMYSNLSVVHAKNHLIDDTNRTLYVIDFNSKASRNINSFSESPDGSMCFPTSALLNTYSTILVSDISGFVPPFRVE